MADYKRSSVIKQSVLLLNVPFHISRSVASKLPHSPVYQSNWNYRIWQCISRIEIIVFARVSVELKLIYLHVYQSNWNHCICLCIIRIGITVFARVSVELKIAHLPVYQSNWIYRISVELKLDGRFIFSAKTIIGQCRRGSEVRLVNINHPRRSWSSLRPIHPLHIIHSP